MLLKYELKNSVGIMNIIYFLKMKKAITLITALFFAIITFGQTPDFTGLKVMVNPGHGGHDGDDRGMTNGFWESESNLTKGLCLRDILESRGCEVIMSRVLNRTVDDLPLSQIAEIANSNNVDLFISIHSNAGNQSSNYPMTIFNGKSDAPAIPEAKVWAQILGDQLITNKATYWTSETPRVIGDLTLNPSWSYGYGVLYPLDVPGIISEGSFHDYQPEVDRLLNLGYRKQEAWNMYYAMVDYFELTGSESFGHITGIVRDSLLVNSSYSILNSPDKYIVVKSTQVKIVETGDIYNVGDTTNAQWVFNGNNAPVDKEVDFNAGFYYFDSLPAGTYHVVFSAEDYFTDTVELVVTGHKFTYWNHWLEADKTMAPKLVSTNPANGDIIKCFDPIQFTFNMNMDSLTFAEAFSISPQVEGEFNWDNEYLNVWFQPYAPYQINTEYNVLVSATAEHQWGVALENEINFSFTTDGRNRFSVESNFPLNNQLDVSPYLQFRIIFDAPIKNSSLIEAVSIINEDGKVIGTKGAKITIVDDKGHYYFVSNEELEYNKNYTLQLLGSIQDLNNIPLVDTVKINFTTDDNPGEFTILDEFEDIDTWDIDFTQSSEIDGNSFLYRWTNEEISGNASMLLRYSFLGTNGTCFVNPVDSIELNSSLSEVGLWIWGEMSNNEIYLVFDNDIELLLSTIDFAGWKYCSIEIPDMATKLTGVKLVQTEVGAVFGDIYIDALSQIGTVSINSHKSELEISVFPNPFTGNVINISGLTNDNVDYKIYNQVGQLLQEGSIINDNTEVKITLNKISKSQNVLFMQLLGAKSSDSFILIHKY